MGKYELKITQNQKNLSNWTLDNSILYAYIDVKYNLNINNLIYNVSFKNKKGSFTNTFTYSKINVPLEIAAPVAYSSQVSYNLNLKASLYKDNKKISQVSVKNGKYLFNDLYFSTPGVYNYVIKQDDSGTKKDGIYTSYIDESEIKVKITVTASGAQLKYKVEFDKIKSFSNKVTVKYNTVENNFEVPIVTNKSNNDVSIPKTKLKIYKDGKVLKTVDSNNNKYAFSIVVSSPGVYKYKLVQEDIVDSGIYKYTIDKSEIYLEITAKIVGNKLVCSNNFVKRNFINKINIVYPELTIPLSFKINSNVSGNIVVPETMAVINGSGFSEDVRSNNGYYTYNVKVKKEGQYVYSISQKNINNVDYQYDIDSNRIVATVNVSAVGDHLSYSINYSRPEFNNSYKEYDLVNLKFSVSITTVKNEQNIDTANTTAYLYDSNNVLLKTSSSDNLYVFDNISVSSAGNYQYRIVQKAEMINLGSNIDYVLDNKEIFVNVNVTNQNGNLRAKINYSDIGFTNTVNVNYSEVIARPRINVQSVMNDGVIKNVEEKASIYTVDGNTKIATVNNYNDAYTFNIPISQPGDYEYIIKQDDSGVQETSDNITFIDDDIKRVTIHCAYANNTLNTNVDYNLDSQLFTNYFLTKEKVLNVPLKIDINNNLSNQRINIPTTTAVLSELNDNGVYENIDTVNSVDGSYNFNNIYIVDEGTYIYKITQKNSGKSKNGIYDYNISDEDKIIIVEVFKEQNGNLNYTIKGDYNSFENSYGIIYDPIVIPFSFNISDNNFDILNGLQNRLIIANDVQVVDSLTVSSPIVTSNKVQIDKEGEYKFKIFQSKPYNYIKNIFSHSFDSMIIEATVNVIADDNNKLTYTISYSDLNAHTFTNVHTQSDSEESDMINVPIDIDVFSNSKDIGNLNMKATIFENGLPFETVINDNNEYSFTGINIVSPGVYVYTIKQVPISNDDWNIDDQIITVNVEVYNDDDGHLKYNISYVDDISSFTNNDLNVVLDGSDDLSVASSNDEVIDNVPFTSLFKGKLLIIVGFVLVGIGYGIIAFYKSIVKRNMNHK